MSQIKRKNLSKKDFLTSMIILYKGNKVIYIGDAFPVGSNCFLLASAQHSSKREIGLVNKKYLNKCL